MGIKEINVLKSKRSKLYERIVIGSEKNAFIELSTVYSIKGFFNIWNSSDSEEHLKSVYEKWIQRTYMGESSSETSEVKLINRICFSEMPKNGPFGEKKYTTASGEAAQFTAGSYSQDKRRREYIAYLLENKIYEKEIERLKGIFKDLIHEEDEEYTKLLKRKVLDFLESKEGCLPGRIRSCHEGINRKEDRTNQMGNGPLEFACSSFFSIIEETLEAYNKIYKTYKENYLDRFEIRYKNSPLDAISRLFVMILAGGYSFYIADKVFPIMGDMTVEELQSEYLYNCYMNWNSSKSKPLTIQERKVGNDIYSSCVKLYNNQKTIELCYILAKIRDEIKMPSVKINDEDVDAERSIQKLLKECILIGECKCKEDCHRAEERNYLVIIANAAYELFNAEYRKRGHYESSKKIEECNKNICEFLKKAAEYNHSDACNIIGDILIVQYLPDKKFQYNNKYAKYISDIMNWNIGFFEVDDNISDDIRKQKVVEEAMRYYHKAGDGHAYLRLAQCLEEKNETNENIMFAWAEAYKRGEYDAKKKIKEYVNFEVLDWKEGKNEHKYLPNSKKKCILCSCSKENLAFAKSLPEDYSIIVVKNGYESVLDEHQFSVLGKMVSDIGNAFNETVVLGEDFNRNNFEDELFIVDYGTDVEHKCERIEYLYKYVEYIAKRYDDKYLISDRVKLCIDLDENMTELHIDRLQRELEDFYIPVFDNMYEKNASIELLSKIPLFALEMQDGSLKEERHIVILGASKTSLQIVKDMVSVCVAIPSIKYYIHLVDKDAKKIKRILLSQCKDIINEDENVNYRLEFNDLDEMEYLNGEEELEYRPKREKNGDVNEKKECTDTQDGTKILNLNTLDTQNKKNSVIKIIDCDYFVCSTDDDMINIELAKKIRMLNLRTTDNYFDLPVIAVLSKDKKLSKSLEGLTISATRKIEYPWYEGLNLIGFGSTQDYYSYDFIEKNWIKKWGMSVNLAYCNHHKNEQLHSAYNDFYSRWYSRDSSYMSALFFIYRFYATGMCRRWFKWDFYAFIDEINTESSELLNNYKQYIQNPFRQEEQGRLEHARWCEWIKSRGWTKPNDDEQVRKYMKSGNGAVKHQLYTAKIHPYIVDWNKLGERITDKIIFELKYLLYRYNNIVGYFDDIGLYRDISRLNGEQKEFQIRLLKDIKDEEKRHNEIKKEIHIIIENLERIRNSLLSNETNNVQSDWRIDLIRECFEVCINRLKELLNAGYLESTDLQAKMEGWYRNYLKKEFGGSTKGHNLMIVTRTPEFLESARRTVG